MENELREKLERFKIKAEQLLEDDKRVFIIDSNDTWYFADLLIVGKNKLTFKPFKGNNSGDNVTKYWADIVKIEEYKEVGENA